MTRILGLTAAVAALLCASSVAAGDADLAPLSLDYRAPAECPSRQEFERRVASRLHARHLDAGAEATARRYRVELRAAPSGALAELCVVKAADAPSCRQIDADSCDHAVTALAVVTALAIDDAFDASSTPTSDGAPGVAVSPVFPVSAGADQPRAPAARSRSEWSFAFGAQALMDTPKAPTPLFGVEAFGELGLPGGRFDLSLALGAEQGTETRTDLGGARFSWFGGRGAACYLATERGATLGIAPCLFVEAGAIVARGAIEHPKTARAPWFSSGASAQLRLRSGSVRFTLEGGPVFPLLSGSQFVFDDGTEPIGTIHDVPALGFFVALGASWTALGRGSAVD